MVFLNQSIEQTKNITFTPEQFMIHVNAVNQANWDSLIYGLVIGFMIGMCALYLGLWYNGRQG